MNATRCGAWTGTWCAGEAVYPGPLASQSCLPQFVPLSLSGPALERFLPWNASPEELRTWAQPPARRVKHLTGNAATGAATANRHVSCRHTRSQDFRLLTNG